MHNYVLCQCAIVCLIRECNILGTICPCASSYNYTTTTLGVVGVAGELYLRERKKIGEAVIS